MPFSDTVRSGQELVVSSFAKKNVCSTEDGIPVSHTLGGDINEKDAPISSPSRDEIKVLLRKVPCFTTPKPPVPGIDAFFPLTRRHFVNLPGNPPIIVVPRLPHGTSEFVLQCINPTQQYIVEKMAEVVRFASFLSKST